MMTVAMITGRTLSDHSCGLMGASLNLSVGATSYPMVEPAMT